MSRIEERVDRPFLVEVARMTVDSHDAGQRCQCCADDGCDQLDWARWELGKHRAARAQTIPPQRPAAPDGRRSKENGMSEKLNWRKPNRCDNSGPNCVEVAHDELTGTRYVRNSTGRSQPVAFTAAEWQAFEESIRAGQQF